MSTRVQWRKGNTAQTAAFTGAVAEITVDTDKKVIVVHDGVTAGGNPAPSLSFVQSVLNRANSAFDAANNATDTWVRNQANSAYDKANSATILAQGAYDSANNVAPQIQPTYDKANNAFAQANLAYNKANSGFDIAGLSYNQANSGFDIAGLSYNQANSGTGIAVSAFGQANLAYNKANSGFDIAGLSYNQANSGTGIAVSAFGQANLAFDKANTVNTDVTAAWQANTGALNIIKYDKAGGDITGSVNVASNVKVGTYIDLTGQSSDPTKTEGRLWYNSTDHVTKVATDISGIDTELGRQLTIKVYNNSGVTITKGAAVYVTGGMPNEAPNVAMAQANSYSTIDSLLGAAQGSIAAGAYGYIVTNGPLTGVDSSAVPSGSIVYVSESSAGGYTASDLAPPNYAVHLGVCLVSHVSAGVIYVDKKGIEWGANFTDGAVAFGNGYRLSQDATKLFWNQTTHRLGIGTNTPTANLHVVGDALFTGNVQIDSNLVISNAQSISTSTLVVGGNLIVLNDTTTGSPVSNAEIRVNRGNSSNVYIKWDEQIDEWIMYEGQSVSGHILHSEKTAKTWADYSAMATYEKLTHPIGADLANSINEIAKSGWNAANTAVTTGQANVGAGLISITGAYQANVGAGLITVTSNYQANVGAGLITKVAKAGDVMTGALTTSGSLIGSSLTSNTSVTVNTSSYGTATAITTASVTPTTLYSFSTGTYRSGRIFAQITSGSAYHVVEMNFVHDGTTVYLAQYGENKTGSSLGTFDASISTGTLSVSFTAASITSTTVKADIMLMAV